MTMIAALLALTLSATPLDSLKFMEGTWSDASHLEIWRFTPQGLLGSYRELEDGGPSFYELATIEPEGDKLVLRMQMFSPGLVPFAKTAAEPLRFTLTEVKGTRAVFVGDDASLTYERVKDTLKVKLDRGAKGVEAFTFTRAR